MAASEDDATTMPQVFAVQSDDDDADDYDVVDDIDNLGVTAAVDNP